MSAWPEAQAEFATALRDPASAPPDFVRLTEGAPSLRRFSVYRNNVAVSLIGALADNYPVLTKLLGGAVFRDLALAYTAAHPPGSPLMKDFGDRMADFLTAYAPTAHLAYLPDIARLERCWLTGYHAADDPVLAISALSGISEDSLPEARFHLHPALGIVVSEFPVASIWQAHQGDDIDEALKRLPAGGESVLLTRPEGDVELRLMPPGVPDFVASLRAGASFAEAAEAGADAADDFDLGAALGLLFEAGAVTRITA